MDKKMIAVFAVCLLLTGLVSQAHASGPWDSERNRYADSFWWGGETAIYVINPVTGDSLFLTPVRLTVRDGSASESWLSKDSLYTGTSYSDTVATGYTLAYLVVETDTITTWAAQWITVLDTMTFTYAVILDSTGAAGESPQLILQDGDGKQLVLQKLNAGSVSIINDEGAINILPSNDVDDYLALSTSSNVPQISNIGGADGSDDFKIITDDGDLYIAPADALDLVPSGDTDDYISISTGSNLPQISGIGGADGVDALKILTDDGDILIAPADTLDLDPGAAVVRIDADFDPMTDNARSFGSSDLRYADGFFGQISLGDTTTGDADAIIYFADDASATAEDFRWDDGTIAGNQFTLSDDLSPASGASHDLGSADADWDSLFVDDVDVDVNLTVGGFILPDADEGAVIGQDGDRFSITFTDTLALGDTTWGDHDALIVAAGDGDYKLHTWGYDDGEDAWYTTDDVKYPAAEYIQTDSLVALDYIQFRDNVEFDAATYDIGTAANHVDSLFVSVIQPASILSIGDSTSVMSVLGVGVAAMIAEVEIAGTAVEMVLYDDDLETTHAAVANIDSAAFVWDVTGDPKMSFYATDGDASTLQSVAGGLSINNEFLQPTATPVIILTDTDVNTDVTTQAEMVDSAAVHIYTEADGDGRIDIVAKTANFVSFYHNGTDAIISTNSGDLKVEVTGNDVFPNPTDDINLGSPAYQWKDYHGSDHIYLGGNSHTATMYISQEGTVAGTDSSLTFYVNSGVPTIQGNATDGDQSDITWNTSDQMLFSNATGGYVFDAALGLSGDVTIANADPTITMYDTDNEDGAVVDSSALILESDGEPSIGFNASDGDEWTQTINTSDQALFQNASGGYLFDDDLSFGAANTPYADLFNAAADPYWLLTDTDVNTTISSQAEAADTNAVYIDCDDTTPLIGIVGGDGDQWDISINTSDQALFSNASGGYVFDAEAHFQSNAAAATFGAVGTDADVVIAFDAVTAQGSITYMEDEDRFDFDNDVDVIGDLTAATISSDATVTATTNFVGVDADLSGDIYLDATKKIVFADDGDDHTYILESGADVLDIYVGGANMVKLTEAAPDLIALAGNMTLTGTFNVTSTSQFDDNMLPDASQGANIGASGAEFNLVWADSVHANWFGGSDFLMGASAANITVSADSFALDDPGTNVNSPFFYLRGDDGGVEEEAVLQLVQGADPYLRISVDSSNTQGLCHVIDIHDQVIAFSVDNQTDIGAAADNRPKDIFAAGDIGVGDDVLMTDTGVIGITGNEIITFNAGGTIVVSGAILQADAIQDDGNDATLSFSGTNGVDVVNAFTAGTVTSDAGVGGTIFTASTSVVPDGDAGANIGAAATAFQYGWIDTIYAEHYGGQSPMSLGAKDELTTVLGDLQVNGKVSVLSPEGKKVQIDLYQLAMALEEQTGRDIVVEEEKSLLERIKSIW